MPHDARGLRAALVAALLAGAAFACQGPDPFYRNRPDSGGAGQGGFAGTFGFGGTAGSAGTTGAAGTTSAAGTTGAAGTGNSLAPCTTCEVKVQYKCTSNDMSQASFVLDVTNESAKPIALSSLTLRYWYTVDPGQSATQVLECDTATVGCTNLVTSADSPGPNFVAVMPPVPTANKYVEIAFRAGALNLDPFLNTGEIQLRLHNKDNSPIKQYTDWSFDCGVKNATIDANRITAYIGGVLVWGTEPN